MKQVLWILLAFVLLCACEEKHFMTDPGYRKMVEQDFQKKKKVLEGNPGNLFVVFDSPMSVEEREALMFLYAYSPLIDLSFLGGRFSVEERALGISSERGDALGERYSGRYIPSFCTSREGWERESGHGPYRFLQGTEGTGCDL